MNGSPGPVKAPRWPARRTLKDRILRGTGKPATLLLVLALALSALVPIALNYDHSEKAAGALVNSTTAPGDGPAAADTATDGPSGALAETTPAGNGTQNDTSASNQLTPSGSDDFQVGASSSNLTVEDRSGSYTIWAQKYAITLAPTGRAIEYDIRPYFTDDVIRYGRLDPLTASEGTVDQNGNDLNGVTTRITAWGQQGNTVWFNESCPEFSLLHQFTIFRDYFELNVTYVPGTKDVLTTYSVSLCSSSGSMYDLFADGVPHRYVPGVPENTPKTNGIGGWFPSYMMFAPAFDLRAPGKDLGVEWGYDETEAYLYSPVWMKGMTVDGSSAFGLKYTSTDSILPNPGLGKAKTFHMFVRPYKYTDGQPRGHDVGYAQWVAPLIAQSWGFQDSPQFPLTFNDFGTWDSSTRSWVESSPILVATQSNNPDQVNWHYKSAQQMVTQTGTMPTDWQLWNSPGHPYALANGHPVASAASPGYRNYLINGDAYNDWWWSSRGVFWDEMNSWFGENNLPRSDYNERAEFVYDGYLQLVQESRASGHWDFVITNSYTAQIQLAMLSDLTLMEGFEPVPSYNIDMKAAVLSTMVFVDNMPSAYRPHIEVYQNYAADSPADQGAVYSALFNAARYGFSVDLLSYASYAAQMHNLQMAVAMFTAMGAERNKDPTLWPACLDLDTEGKSITTDRPMVVLMGAGPASITFTKVSGSYTLTNLGSTALTFDLVLPSGGPFVLGPGLTQIGSLETLANGQVVLHGSIAAETTASLSQGTASVPSGPAPDQVPAAPQGQAGTAPVSRP